MVKVTHLHWATNDYKYQFGINRVSGGWPFKYKVREYGSFIIYTWWIFFFIITKD